jgi:sigma-B regulation protein RsbU (phosphoserine phosphatase)
MTLTPTDRELAPAFEEAACQGVSCAPAADTPPCCLDLATIGELLASHAALATAPTLEEGFGPLLDLLARLVPADTAAILLLDPLGRELSYVATRGIPTEVATHWRFGLGQGIVGTVARTNAPIQLDDVRRDGRYIATQPGLLAELAVPIAARGRALGVLDLHRHQRTFDTNERALAEFLATHLGPVIEQAQRHQASREQARTLALLHDVGRELGSILDRRQLLERVGRQLERLIGFDQFTVLLWNEETRLLEPWLALGPQGLIDAPVVRGMALGQGLCGTAAVLQQAIRAPNVFLDPRYERCQSGFEVRSELVVPLAYEGQLLGVLDLESAEYDAFREDHERLLVTLASTLSVALESARLFERVREEEQRLSADLETARQIQLQLLPKASPWLPGLQLGVAHEAARQLGGDFYDYLAFGKDRVGIAVGDVAGKSTGAALYGSFAVGLLRELWQHQAEGGTADLGALLADLNCSLHGLGVGNRFLAMALALYDSASRRLLLVNAGLPCPLWVRRGGSVDAPVVETISASGIPLGMFADRSWQIVDLQLGAGDYVVFATDGLEEALDREERELGAERLQDALAALVGRAAEPTASDVAQELLAEVRRHALGSEPSDDRTVVVLHVL